MPSLPAPPILDNVDAVVADPLRFKAKLAIGEAAYTSLRLINRTREVWDVLGAAGAGAAVAKTGLAASLLGASATPLGWVAVAALASGGACYGMYRLLSSTKGDRVIEIPRYLNTPLDTLGLAIFDLIAPIALRLALVDGQIEDAERAHLVKHLVGDWGMNRAFVEQALAAIEPRLEGSSLEAMATEGAQFLHMNPDCNHAAIAKELGVFLQAMLEAGGPLTAQETGALATTVRLLATAPPGELSKAWTQAVGYAGGAAGQVTVAAKGVAKEAAKGISAATEWTQQRLPDTDQLKAQAGEASAQALEAARKAAAWTQERLPSAGQVKTTAEETAAQALEAARKAAAWTQERLPSAEQVKAQTAEGAAQAVDAAKKGLEWARDQAARAAASGAEAGAGLLNLKRDKLKLDKRRDPGKDK